MFTSLSGLLVIAAIGHQGLQLSQPAPASMSLTVMCEGAADHRRLRFTIKNTGAEAASVVVGSVVNGRIDVVDGLTLLVKQSPGDRVDRYEYQPAAISDRSILRVEFLWIAQSYTTTVDVSDFERRRVLPKAAELSLEWQIEAQAGDLGVPPVPKWGGGTLRSNTVRFPEQCKP